MRYVYKLQSSAFWAAHFNVNVMSDNTTFRYYLHVDIKNSLLKSILKCKIMVILKHFVRTRSMWFQSIIVKSITWIIYIAWRL